MKKYQIITLKSNSINTKIYIGSDCVLDLGRLLMDAQVGPKCVIITNPTLRKLYGEIVLESCTKAGFQSFILEIPDGENHKNMSTVQLLLDQILAHQLERNDTLLALGGGVIGDITGFVASIYLRGIHVVQIPTSLLAQVDSSVGGKTGVNHALGKNLIGTFYQPLFTFIDTATLKTLPQDELRCGMAEVIKYGIIRNRKLFKYLESLLVKMPQAVTLCDLFKDEAISNYVIFESCRDKAFVVSKDEKEAGLRAILNFGHTLGHAIEGASDYTIYRHGEAVALGILGACMISKAMGMISDETFVRIEKLLLGFGFDLQVKSIHPDKIISFLSSDKKIKNGKLRFVLPTDIGKVVIRDDVPLELIRSVVGQLMA